MHNSEDVPSAQVVIEIQRQTQRHKWWYTSYNCLLDVFVCCTQLHRIEDSVDLKVLDMNVFFVTLTSRCNLFISVVWVRMAVLAASPVQRLVHAVGWGEGGKFWVVGGWVCYWQPTLRPPGVFFKATTNSFFFSVLFWYFLYIFPICFVSTENWII